MLDDPKPPNPSRTSRFESPRLHRIFAASRAARALTIGLMARVELAILSGHKPSPAIRIIRSARRSRESLLGGNEAYTLYSLARAQSALEGEMAELGVYQGCSAMIISQASGGRPLHLFDTFAGLPKPGTAERRHYEQGHYAAALAPVQRFLHGRPGIHFHVGLFPQSTGPVRDRRFSFVHLDVDLHDSTRAGLEFFYPRMIPGGILVTHDYSYLGGVRAAFDGFLADKPELPIELPTSQAMFVKR